MSWSHSFAAEVIARCLQIAGLDLVGLSFQVKLVEDVQVPLQEFSKHLEEVLLDIGLFHMLSTMLGLYRIDLCTAGC